MEKKEETQRIVVGVDGSASSRMALAWAAKQAELIGSPLTALITWKYSTSVNRSGATPKVEDHELDAKQMLASTVASVLGTAPSTAITQSVVQGHPSLVLVDESKTAGLLVVGSRGHGEFIGMLLGSVGQYVAGHAHCPVVIVRDGDDG